MGTSDVSSTKHTEDSKVSREGKADFSEPRYASGMAGVYSGFGGAVVVPPCNERESAKTPIRSPPSPPNKDAALT